MNRSTPKLRRTWRQSLTADRLVLLVARTVSLLFTPFYFSTVAFIVLLFLSPSYLRLLDVMHKLYIVLMVYLFTVVLPVLAIWLYRYINGLARHELGQRERRIIPYILSISSYTLLIYIFASQQIHRNMLGILVGALAMQVVCSLLTPLVKPSTHVAGAAGVAGMVLAFSFVLHFDPTLWLSGSILLTGLVASSRIILRYHTLKQVGISVIIGLLCGFLGIVLI
ncbi:MAG: hypothetical protein Q4A44_05775 [Bacteroidales bacterium]|nr:hypothetical protein [Bacteroidales bacterium]